MQFQELAGRQWNMIKPHVPKTDKTGRPRCDDRTILNGITHVLISGCRWSEMPKRHGDGSTANKRPSSWQQKGVRKKILRRAIAAAHKSGKPNLQKISADSSTIPSKKGEMQSVLTVSRGLQAQRFMLQWNQAGLPVSIRTSPANEHGSTKFIDVMESISEFVDDETLNKIVTVYADRGYDAKYIRNYCRCHGIGCCIPNSS